MIAIIIAVLLVGTVGQQPLLTCRVTEQNPVSQEFALHHDGAHTLYPHCDANDTRAACDKGQYKGAILKARIEDGNLVPVSTIPRSKR